MYEVLAMLFAWLGAWGQAPAVPGAKDADAKGAEAKEVALGSYSLVTTDTEASGTAHWLNPPLTIEVPAGTEYVPAETAGNLTVPAQFAADGFGARRYECAAATPTGDAPRGGGCKALDETELTIRDANTIGYHIVTHGAARAPGSPGERSSLGWEAKRTREPGLSRFHSYCVLTGTCSEQPIFDGSAASRAFLRDTPTVEAGQAKDVRRCPGRENCFSCDQNRARERGAHVRDETWR